MLVLRSTPLASHHSLKLRLAGRIIPTEMDARKLFSGAVEHSQVVNGNAQRVSSPRKCRADDRGVPGRRAHDPMKTFFVWRYSRRPSSPPSRPNPLIL